MSPPLNPTEVQSRTDGRAKLFNIDQYATKPERPGLRLNEHLEHPEGLVVFQHACALGAEGIVSKRLGSRYRCGHSADWLKLKNPAAPAVRREAEEDWAR